MKVNKQSKHKKDKLDGSVNTAGELINMSKLINLSNS